jgi:hypothetical protein
MTYKIYHCSDIVLNPTHIVPTEFHLNKIYSVIHMDVNYDSGTENSLGGGDLYARGDKTPYLENCIPKMAA